MANTSTSDSRPPPKDFSHYLSRNAKNREASSVKQFYKYFQIPGIGQLAGGLPNGHYFPFDTLEAKVSHADRWEPTPNHPVDRPSNSQVNTTKEKLPHKASTSIVVPHASQEKNPLKKIDLESALQYGTTQGYPPLYYFLRQLTRDHMHPNIPYRDGAEILLTCGNTDGFGKVLQALTNEWSEERDWSRDREGLLVEKFCYMNAVQAAKPRGLNIVPVEIDDEGMLAKGRGGLEHVLANWDYKTGKRPHLIYTVTMGQNPTSGVLSLQRRRELYAVCQKYDIIIIEDDPYWYLQFPTATAKSTKPKSSEPELPPGWKTSGYDFLDSLVPSSLNIDTDGRVIRLDTFSKTVAPGCRLGWITAQPALIERLLRITETSTQQPSGFVQSMIAELLLGPGASDGKGPAPEGKGWNADGWVRWIEGLRGNYERRMNTMATILDEGKEAVKTGRRNSLSEALAANSLSDQEDDEWSVVEKSQMYSFDWPVGGMFLWVRLHFDTHPLAGKVPGPRLSRAMWIYWTIKPYRVLVVPGLIFSPTDAIREKEGWQYFRLCFAACDDDQLAPISKRFVDAVNAFWRIRTVKKIDEILTEDDQGGPSQSAMPQDMSQLSHLMGPCAF